ncbi:MAG: DNA-directed RNA polymerase subunit beta', partial [Clostridia bacterium]|nr:DNA-directed RNA polymerase subunit beta' [Clostridia bacterium]
CYGKNMATNTPVQAGEAVGVIAAQSIGEPGTQLTMRTFHTGGIAATGDITQGLPRVEELFEARKPKGCATLCEVSGKVKIDDTDNLKHVIVVDPVTGEVKKDYALPFNAELKVRAGDTVTPGTILNTGSVYPQDILRVQGVKGVQDYILEQIQSVYRSQGVDINDKHVEIIVRQMLKKVRIENSGSTGLLPGEMVDMFTVEEENTKAIEEGGAPALQKRVLLGITKAALSTESFLSAASFQETARVLTDAAIKNKVDPLMGLKENVIIGKLIPAGTGVKEYKSMSPIINPNYGKEETENV